MNGLALRISRGGSAKHKNPIAYSPVHIPSTMFENSGVNTLYKQFIESSSTDEQLSILKKVLDSNKEVFDKEVATFLAVVFLQAVAKHPVKCFVSRQITKNSQLQQTFTEALSVQITLLLNLHPPTQDTPKSLPNCIHSPIDPKQGNITICSSCGNFTVLSIENTDSTFKELVEVIGKIATCIENFNAGVEAVKIVHVQLGVYIRNCIRLCVDLLSSETVTHSPTEKNEICTLAHLCLRLFLHVIQRASNDSLTKLNPIVSHVRLYLGNLMVLEDVPMDTKSVCGILYLTLDCIVDKNESWISILSGQTLSDTLLRSLLLDNAAELSVYSAIATVVPTDKLLATYVKNETAILALTRKLLDIGDKNASESTFILAITRTLLQLSKSLDRFTDSAIGSVLVDLLLGFAWNHLEHYMDSVRHLTAQILGCVVGYCAKLDKKGDSTPLTKLLSSLSLLDKSRKSYYVSLSCLATELGGRRLLNTLPFLVTEGLVAINSQPVQACATTALETLLNKHSLECSTQELYSAWVEPVLRHVEGNELDPNALGILETLLVKAVKLDNAVVDYIIPYIKQSCDLPHEDRDLKCILMLSSVVRKSSVAKLQESIHEWKGILTYELLRRSAIHPVDEIRILSLSLVVESPKTTEVFTEGDLSFILWYLQYNINAQAPNFRQLTLSLLKKFIKRFEDGYKVIRRQNQPDSLNPKVDYYLQFAHDLRHLCFGSLLVGANYSRRYVALQVLVWCDLMKLEGFERTWSHQYVDRLLLCLEDSYEGNKAFALEVLNGCPKELLQANTYSISLDLEHIFQQASSLKPTDCVSAAYKLSLLRNKLPENILQGEKCETAEPVTYSAVRKLLSVLRAQVCVCERSVVLAARGAPLFGALHCTTHLLKDVDPRCISTDAAWSDLLRELICACARACAGVSHVVNDESPEGLLPRDALAGSVTDRGNEQGIVLDDGRQVTAQMVLLCAWRTVKEVSLLLGTITSRLTISEDGSVGSLSVAQVTDIGEHFISLLAETKHRGAFEQAYVGFTQLLTRVWRGGPALRALARSWLRRARGAAAGGGGAGLCATRRSAGLPFMILALVSTEQSPGPLRACMRTLRWCATRDVRTRCHALNVARALLRSSALRERVAGHVAPALVLALQGFQADSWAERNSSTLLFSALMVHIFGVAREKRAEALCVRNKMTGRIFFLRYPQLYDYMLNKLKEASESEAQLLCPSLFPVLLLLARLYPSSLEGTVSNLKLGAFVPHVQRCARSGVLEARRLAASAVVPLVAPDEYSDHIASLITVISDPRVPRNHCHGVLLQLNRLLNARPSQVTLEVAVEPTLWVLEQARGGTPCYMIADEYVQVLNVLIWRFPEVLQKDTACKIISHLDPLIFTSNPPIITSGRDICLANATYLYFVIQNKFSLPNITEIILKTLSHTSYEVKLSGLKYLLILHNNLDSEMSKFEEHLASLTNNNTIKELKNNNGYIHILCNLLKNEYLECQQKSLKILVLHGNTQADIVTTKFNTNINKENIIEFLINSVQNESENLTHIYLESLFNYVSELLKESDIESSTLLNVLRVVFECSSSDNSDDTRTVVVGFLENNVKYLLDEKCWKDLSDQDKFELKATILASSITLLEDDESNLRQRISNSFTTTPILPTACGSEIRDAICRVSEGEERVALFVTIALLDFRSMVCLTDEGNDECRVFDQNERYNIYLEETIWTCACADYIISAYNNKQSILSNVIEVINKQTYRQILDKLCNDNVKVFNKVAAGGECSRNEMVNPKVEVFLDKLKGNN